MKKEWLIEKLKSWDCIVDRSGTKFPKILKQHVSKDFIKIILKDGYRIGLDM